MVATYDGGEVRASAVAREARFLSKDEAQFRAVMQHDQSRREHDWAQRQALRALGLKLAQADADVFDNPAWQERARAAARNWILAEWRKDCYSQALQMPTDEAIREQARGELKPLPRRVKLSHIYLRADDKPALDSANLRLTQLRTQIQGIDSFRQLAKQLSQSESASKGGSLGVIWPGFLAPEAEQAVFAMGEGELSAPIALRGGVHLFYVEEVLPAGTTSLDQAFVKRRGELLHQAQDRCKQRALKRSSFAVATKGDQFRVGNWLLPRALAAAAYPGKQDSESAALARYQEAETLYQLALASDWLDPDRAGHSQDLQADIWLDLVLSKQYRDQFQPATDDQLREWFDALASKPKRRMHLAFVQLSTELPDKGIAPLAFRNTLEQIGARVAKGELNWDQALELLPAAARVQHWPSTDLKDIVDQIGPVLFEGLKRLEPGQVSPPLRELRQFNLLQLTSREPGRELSFNEAREEIERRWNAQDAKRMRSALSRQMLEDHHFIWLATPRTAEESMLNDLPPPPRLHKEPVPENEASTGEMGIDHDQ